MGKYKKFIILVILSMAVLTGCISKWKAEGSIQINIAWPKVEKRLIPFDTKSIVIELYKEAKLVDTKKIERKIDETQVQAIFDNLTTGTYTIVVYANNDDRTLARGKTIVLVKAGENTAEIELKEVLMAPHPNFSPGTYDNEFKLMLYAPHVVTMATIKYTINGKDPNILSPTLALGEEITVNKSMIIKAACLTVDGFGEIGTYEYILQVRKPQITQNVSGGAVYCMMESTSGAAIYYTTDGKDPTSSSAVYIGPFDISKITTIKAIGIREGWEASETAMFVKSSDQNPEVLQPQSGVVALPASPVTLTYTDSGNGVFWSKAINKVEITAPDGIVANVSYDAGTLGEIKITGYSFKNYGTYTIKVYAEGYQTAIVNQIIYLSLTKGELSFDKIYYEKGETARIVLKDMDRNINPYTKELVSVKIHSASQTSHTYMNLEETAADSGEFATTVELGENKTTGVALYFHNVVEGDSVTVYYDDMLDDTGMIAAGIAENAYIYINPKVSASKYGIENNLITITYNTSMPGLAVDISKIVYRTGASMRVLGTYTRQTSKDSLTEGTYFIDLENNKIYVKLNNSDYTYIESDSAFDSGGVIVGAQDSLEFKEGAFLLNGIAQIPSTINVEVTLQISIFFGISNDSFAKNGRDAASDRIYMTLYESDKDIILGSKRDVEDVTSIVEKVGNIYKDLKAGYYIIKFHVGTASEAAAVDPVSKFWFRMDQNGNIIWRGSETSKQLPLKERILVGELQVKYTNTKGMDSANATGKAGLLVYNNGTNIEKEPVDYCVRNITNSSIWYNTMIDGNKNYDYNFDSTMSLMMKKGYPDDKSYSAIMTMTNPMGGHMPVTTGFKVLSKSGDIVGKYVGADNFIEDYVEVDAGSFPLMLNSRTGDVNGSNQYEQIDIEYSKTLTTDAITSQTTYITISDNISTVKGSVPFGPQFLQVRSDFNPYNGRYDGQNITPFDSEYKAPIILGNMAYDKYGNKLNKMYFDVIKYDLTEGDMWYWQFNPISGITQHNFISLVGQEPTADGKSKLIFNFENVSSGNGIPYSGNMNIRDLYTNQKVTYPLVSLQKELVATGFDLHGRFEAYIDFTGAPELYRSKIIYFSVP